jgi:phosphate-selective porin OprO/OprP
MNTQEIKRNALCVFLLMVLASFSAAQVSAPETILICNVRLIDRDGKTEDQTVNILIKQKKLDIVTKDDIPVTEGILAVDAQNGVLLGTLNVGKPCSFLILDQDPRGDFEILLDTEAHVQFAVHNGMIVKNNLEQVIDSTPEATAKKNQQWFAYTPPPVALPVSYQDSTKWNQWDSNWVSVGFTSALALDRQRWLSQDDASKQQVGDLRDEDGGEIRAFRFGFFGALKFEKPWIYTIAGATNSFSKGFEISDTDDVTFFDWRLDIPIDGDISLAVGKQKEPISMERLIGMVFLPWQERTAVADALLPSRNVGAVLSGTGLDRRMTWAGGVFNDWFDTNKHINESATQYIGRVTCLPWFSEDESNLVHLGMGLRHTDAKEGVRYHSEPEFNKSPTFVDTDFFEADSALTHSIEASWRTGPFWLNGEYIGNDVNASEHGNPLFSGYHIGASWILTGEMRPYNRRNGLFGPVPVAKSVDQGGLGAWEAGLRWSEVDLSDGPVEGGEMDIFSVGLNWFLKPTFHVTVNYRHIFLDRFDTEGESDGVALRLVLML